LIEIGNAKQCEIIRAFGVSEISVKRYIKKYREAEGDTTKYFKPRNTRGASVLTPEKIKEIEEYYHKTCIRKKTDLSLKANFAFFYS